MQPRKFRGPECPGHGYRRESEQRLKEGALPASENLGSQGEMDPGVCDVPRLWQEAFAGEMRHLQKTVSAAKAEEDRRPRAVPVVLPSFAGERMLVPGQGTQLWCWRLRGNSPSLVEGCVMVVQGIGDKKAQVHLCREDVRVEVAGKTSRLHTLYDWGVTVTLVTHAAAKRAGLKRTRQTPLVIARLSSECTMVDSHYMVPVVNRDDKVRTVKAMGVSHIMTLEATEVPADIEKRFLQARGYGNKLVRPAKDVELLIGMDNQGWMPKHIGSSQVKGDNLRLMQSMLIPLCILLGSAKRADPGDGTQGNAGGQPRETGQPSRKRQELRLADCMQVMMVMMLIMLAGTPECTAFQAYDCNNLSA
jgi:hypothetical protein